MNIIKKFFTVILIIFISCKVYGQKQRVDSVLLHETFESSSSTASKWTASSSSSSCSKWAFATTTGGGALGSDKYIIYNSSTSSSGCYSTTFAPTVSASQVSTDDTIIVDFYMYRSSSSYKDFLNTHIMDVNYNIVYAFNTIYEDASQFPAVSPGWGHYVFKIDYNTIVAKTGSSDFIVAFTGVSDGGVDIRVDEIKIHHIYYVNPRILKVTNPKKGDTVTAGQKITTSWTYNNVDNVVVEYSLDSGKNYSQIVVSDPSFQTYPWTIPVTETNNAFIRLSDYVDKTFFVTEGPFSIAWPVKMLNFKGGDSVMGGTTVPILWRSRNTVSTVNIDVSIDGGFTYVSVAKKVNSPSNTNNTYSWNVPFVQSKTAKMRITDNNGNIIESASYFKIAHNTGIAEDNIAPKVFSCYPNPAHDKILVRFLSGMKENCVIKISDAAGRVVLSKNVQANSNESIINIESIPSGVYLIEITGKTITANQRLVVN
jgi:hypothetical protein